VNAMSKFRTSTMITWCRTIITKGFGVSRGVVVGSSLSSSTTTMVVPLNELITCGMLTQSTSGRVALMPFVAFGFVPGYCTVHPNCHVPNETK
jgi:hypothetical protein